MAGWYEDPHGFFGSQGGYTGEPEKRPIVTFPQVPTHVELPGSNRALQQWLQKQEYQGMQVKGHLQTLAAYGSRIQSAAVNQEKRQDSCECSPPDFLRHWRQTASKEERHYMCCQAARKHMESGVCCLPGCLVWLWQLRLEAKLEAKWKKQEKEDKKLLQRLESLAAREREQDGGSKNQ